MLYWAKFVIQFINEGIAVGHVDFHDCLIGYLIYMLHQGADAVAMGN